MESVECGVWSVECGVWSVECGECVVNSECGEWKAWKHGKSEECRMRDTRIVWRVENMESGEWKQ